MKSRTPTLLSLVLVFVVGNVLVDTGPALASDALTQHYNNARTGAILDETILNTTTVRSGTFGKLWTLFADGQISAQPLYVSALPIDTTGNANTPLVRGRFNALILATMHNTV